VTKIRLGTGQTETGGNFYAYVDAIDFSWETGYSTSRNMQSLQLGYNYLGKCSFTDDTVGVNPTGWTVVEGSNVEIQVISDLSLHRKVVSFWDNNNGPGSCYMEYSFPGVVVGTVELWVFGIDGNAGLDHFGIELFGGSTNAVHTYADWTTDEYVNYMDKSIVAPGGFPNNQWHHIRIVFDCNSDTFTCYVNGNYTGIFNFESPISSVTKIRLGTGQTETGGNFYAYVDAIDFSWETGYYTNRNMQYTTDQQIPMLTPTTVILIVLFSVIGLIIKLNKRYPRYSSGTIDFLKP
jgi:hypothetical protein